MYVCIYVYMYVYVCVCVCGVCVCVCVRARRARARARVYCVCLSGGEGMTVLTRNFVTHVSVEKERAIFSRHKRERREEREGSTE